MREATEEETLPRDGLGILPTIFVTEGPKTVPRVDYERVFVLDEDARLLGEYALRDDCPLEFDDLRRSVPVNGMRHLVSFYQGEFAFTPFRVENLWFVVLTRGVPRIEDRGAIGTLLAAMRLHLPPTLAPAVAAREAALRDREREVDMRESALQHGEERLSQIEADLQVSGIRLKKLEAEVRTRETRLNALRDYAMQMQRAFRGARTKPPIPNQEDENPPQPDAPGTHSS